MVLRDHYFSVHEGVNRTKVIVCSCCVERYRLGVGSARDNSGIETGKVASIGDRATNRPATSDTCGVATGRAVRRLSRVGPVHYRARRYGRVGIPAGIFEPALGRV